ncbi:hypothetical protein [Halorussus salinisoli]|uniref:hypothetical protein n=1 Tax=Halorussus salinisoli TaxID=2558242 RepID=UPI0010C21F7C|nr:hypothetical protein [Halorussus salinisoli]
MDRREFLATGATLAIATAGGCTGCAKAPAISLRMEPINDHEIAEEVTYRVEVGPSDRRRLVADAVGEESVTVEDTDAPFPADEPFVYDGSVYRLSYEIVESKPATTFQFTLDPAEGSVSESETIRYDELPAVDREKLDYDGSFLGFGSSLLYLDSEIPDSALVPDPERSVIVWDSETKGRFEVDGSIETDLKTYRYESEQVHPSAEEYGAQIRERYEFELSGLTDAERDIVSEAIEESDYSVPHDESPPDAALKLATRFRPHEEVRYAWEDEADAAEAGRVDGTYLVRHDGELYWTSIHVSRDQFATTAKSG